VIGVGYLLLRRKSIALTPVQWRVVYALISIAVTAVFVALGALSPDLFSAVAAKIKVGEGTLTIGGPIAVLISVYKGVSSVRANRLKEEKVTECIDVKSVLEHQFRLSAFKYYGDWKAELGDFRKVIQTQESELHFIEDLLPKVFYHGSRELLKPKNVTTTTLFLFLKDKAIKFQRIQGNVRIERDKRAEIYLAQTPSTPTGRAPGFHFFRCENGANQVARHVHGEWKDAPSNKIDLLITSLYEGDEVVSGDYVYVDVSKYVNFECGESATVNLAIISDRPIAEFRLWDVSASVVNTARPVPLIFRKLGGVDGRRTPRSVKRQKEKIAKLFEGWDQIIDQAAIGNLGADVGTSKEEVEQFLRRVKNALAQDNSVSFIELFKKLPGKDCIVCKLEDQQNVILSTFAWRR